jgi:hypothetical protein
MALDEAGVMEYAKVVREEALRRLQAAYQLSYPVVAQPQLLHQPKA